MSVLLLGFGFLAWDQSTAAEAHLGPVTPSVFPSVAPRDGSLDPVADYAVSLLQRKVQKTMAIMKDDFEVVRDVMDISLGRQDLAHAQPSNTGTSQTGYFARIKESFGKFATGIILLMFSIPVLWLNEKRSAKMECLISIGRSSCISVIGATSNPDNRGRLVHIKDQKTHAAASVRDQQFKDAIIYKKCLRLRSSVEVFQWAEYSDEKEVEKVGGSKERVKTHWYKAMWASCHHDSNTFHNTSNEYRNKIPSGLALGQCTTNCSCVEYGSDFVLPDALLDQCIDFESADHELPEKLTVQDSGHTFQVHTDHHFYFRSGGAKPEDVVKDPQIGDSRVCFDYVREGDATVVALQAEQSVKQVDGRDIFLPYRVISRGLCGMNGDQERAALIAEGKKSREQLARDDQCTGGPLGCLCCACNIVACLFAGLLTTEIFHLYQSKKGAEEFFCDIGSRNHTTTWIFRLVGWLMMLSGLYAIFSPIITLLAVIPLFSHCVGWAIWILCCLVTIALSSLIVALAHLLYRPLVGLMYFLPVGAVVSLPWVVPLVLGWK